MSGVSFQHIPSDSRVPLFYAEMDNSAANQGGQALNALLIGQMLPTGSAAQNTPIPVADPKSAVALFGQGSMLARMVTSYRYQDAGSCNLWCIPLADEPEGASAAGTIEVSGEASAAGTVFLYIAGQRVAVGAQTGDAAEVIAASIAAAINAAADLPVSAEATADSVKLTCKWKGATGNDITIQDSFLGWSAGESLPSGVTLTYSGLTLAQGAGDPTLASTALLAMGDEPYDFVVHPYAQAQALNDVQLEMNDATGRWSYARQIYGHGYTARRDTLSGLVAFGMTRNDQHHTVAAIDVDCPNPGWEYAAAYGGANAVDIADDPARPTQTTPLYGLLAPRVGKRFLYEDRQALLSYGIATSYVSGGQLCVERAITTYQQNSFGSPDTSYLDSETLHTSAYVLRYLKTRITSKYSRHKLADDGTRFASGQAIVTPSVIRGELCAAYGELEYLGIVEDLDTFKKNLIVERDTTNPNRVNVLLPPEYVGQLRTFAVLNQFRLGSPSNQIAA